MSRHDGWERGQFFTARYEAISWANRAVGAARSIAMPLPDGEWSDMRNLAIHLRKCADELDAAAKGGGNTEDIVSALAFKETAE